ncbi:MAG TPA: HypC/HybG/HupF family hydrogenase formation chaperone [Actinocrinis sp.]|nr:HypC/HybG/HupF family hydrogenase formation chaperone [Actinocrinis sp.]
MCLGIPGKIVEVWDEESGARMARVEFRQAGTAVESRRICLAYLPELQVGDYTIVHAGFALTRIEEASALETIATMAEYGVFGQAAEIPAAADRAANLSPATSASGPAVGAVPAQRGGGAR